MFSNYVTEGGRVYGVKNNIGPSADRWERSGSGLIIDSDSLKKLHPILDIFSWKKKGNKFNSKLFTRC